MNKKFIPLNEKIKYLRLLNRKTQLEVANALCITRNCLSNYETGIREPDINMLKSLSRLFGVDISYFFENGPASDFPALSETDKKECMELVSKIRKKDSIIDTKELSLTSKIALFSFHDYLKFCDEKKKFQKGSDKND